MSVTKGCADRCRREGRDADARLWDALIVLPTDYTDYGGEVERWKDPEGIYPDCSCCCKWAAPLWDADYAPDYESGDWLVCTKPGAPRTGMLTWEHQAGHDCWECDPDYEEETS